MAKNYLGVDIGYSHLKLAYVAHGKLRTVLTVPTPPELLKAGRLTSTAALGEMIQHVIKDNGLSVKDAAVVLSGETTYFRTITMRRMRADQLVYNLPYEFSDYITDDLKNYVFDYATITTSADAGKGKNKDKKKADKSKFLSLKIGRQKEEEQPPAEETAGEAPDGAAEEAMEKGGAKPEDNMEILAVAAPKSLIDELGQAMSKSGLRFSMAAPVEFSYILLMRAARAAGKEVPDECCFVDLGYKSIRMHIFQGDKHVVTRVMEPGLSDVVNAVASAFSVDAQTAEDYLISNRDNCQTRDFCQQTYSAIAVELMRSLNFYRFSNPDSAISEVLLCGGGSALRPLGMSIAQALNIKLRPAFELLPTDESFPNLHLYVQATGISLV